MSTREANVVSSRVVTGTSEATSVPGGSRRHAIDNSTRARGFPRASPSRRSRSVGSSPGAWASMIAPAASSSRGPSRSSSNSTSPSASPTGPRLVAARTIGSASMRRATKASTSAVKRSSQCTSSATSSSGPSAARSRTRFSAASATDIGSSTSVSAWPNAPSRESRCDAGRSSACFMTGRSIWWRPAKGRWASDGTPDVVRTAIPRPRANVAAAATSDDFPMPGSPSTRRRAPRSSTESRAVRRRSSSDSRPWRCTSARIRP